MLDSRYRKNINIDDLVHVVKKEHQISGELTEGVVKKILTNSKFHPHGIKVLLDTGEVGRVQQIIEED